MRHILAIRFARLGDVILLLPALTCLKSVFPKARLTFLTAHRCAPVAGLCPAIDEVISVDRIAMRDGRVPRALTGMAKLVRDIRRRHFDLVIDFHSFRETNLLTRFSGAPQRLGIKRYNEPYLSFCFNLPPVPEDKNLHVSEMFLRVVQRFGSEAAPARTLVIPPEIAKWVDESVPAGPRLALYINAPVPERIWPPENFSLLADYAIEKFDASVLVLSGPGDEDLADRVRRASRSSRDRLAVFTGITIPQLAGLITSARLLVSNDTGPMHLGPAVGVPTLGLFSVGYPEHFRPVGSNSRFLRANPIERIETSTVIDTAEEMWATAGRDLRR